MKKSRRVGVVGVVALVTTGCIAPPLRIGAGGGGAGGGIVTVDRQGKSYDHSTAAIGELRAAFTPLSLTDEPPAAFDLSIGCALDYVAAQGGAARHDQTVAPFAEAAWFPAVGERHTGWRVGPTFQAELPLDVHSATDRDRGLAFGLGAGVLAELIDRVDGPMLFGKARGYWGFGLALRGGVRHEDETYGYVMLTVEVRMPGLAALPIPAPDKRPGLNY